ncbi:MAG: hypothetical protein KDA74_17640, partial [Planctomycetaceae bacterium]|nr:hypothetical protein [Planctomycetaceae bacterium]
IDAEKVSQSIGVEFSNNTIEEISFDFWTFACNINYSPSNQSPNELDLTLFDGFYWNIKRTFSTVGKKSTWKTPKVKIARFDDSNTNIPYCQLEITRFFKTRNVTVDFDVSLTPE